MVRLYVATIEGKPAAPAEWCLAYGPAINGYYYLRCLLCKKNVADLEHHRAGRFTCSRHKRWTDWYNLHPEDPFAVAELDRVQEEKARLHPITPPTAPGRWKQWIDPHGRAYWHQSASGRSEWKLPPDAEVEPEDIGDQFRRERSSPENLNPSGDAELPHEDELEKWSRSKYYEQLELPTTATAVEIRKAYLSIVVKRHQDKVDREDFVMATEYFQHVKQAFDVLSNPIWKRAYDQMALSPRASSPKRFVTKTVRDLACTTLAVGDPKMKKTTADAAVSTTFDSEASKGSSFDASRSKVPLDNQLSMGPPSIAELSKGDDTAGSNDVYPLGVSHEDEDVDWGQSNEEGGDEKK